MRAAGAGSRGIRPGSAWATLLLATVFLVALQSSAAYAASNAPDIKRSSVQVRAGYGVGYSYWWGGGRWSSSVNTSDGSCCGTCGSCSHWASKTRNSRCGSDEAGVVERGADCSGYVATAWMVRPDDSSFSILYGGHPYSTYDFRYNSQKWYTFTSLSSLKSMDAAVRYDSTMHHIVLFHQRDAYGQPIVYEGKGCASGVVYGKRTLDSHWVGVRRDNIIDG